MVSLKSCSQLGPLGLRENFTRKSDRRIQNAPACQTLSSTLSWFDSLGTGRSILILCYMSMAEHVEPGFVRSMPCCNSTKRWSCGFCLGRVAFPLHSLYLWPLWPPRSMKYESAGCGSLIEMDKLACRYSRTTVTKCVTLLIHKTTSFGFSSCGGHFIQNSLSTWWDAVLDSLGF